MTQTPENPITPEPAANTPPPVQSFARSGVAEYMIIGLHLAALQYAYLFLLEAYLSSRSVTYFICLFFWLVGFLAGLNIRKQNLLLQLIIAGWAGYGLSYFLHNHYPYSDYLYPILAAMIAVSGLQAGYFFTSVANKRHDFQQILLHENNGFVVGTLLCMVAVLYAGWYFLAYVPTVLSILALIAAWRLSDKARATS